VRDSRTPRENTTQDWATTVDHEHLAQVREQPVPAARLSRHRVVSCGPDDTDGFPRRTASRDLYSWSSISPSANR
jgi:hypothetical protein